MKPLSLSISREALPIRPSVAAFLSALLLSLIPAPVRASTLVLEGGIGNTVEVRQVRSFTAPAAGLSSLRFRYASPAPEGAVAVDQRISGHDVEYSPEPATVRNETDRLGNRFTVVTWKGLRGRASVTETFTVDLDIRIEEMKSAAPFPLPASSISAKERRFLDPTPLVESGSPEIRALAGRLTSGAATELEAATSILNWVVDNVTYRSPIPEYGALWTLRTRHGNCQNFSHLSIALLRASGIPARIVGGIALGKAWRVPMEDGSLMQTIGQGGHAWIEVYYPDLGWVPYDAQQSHLFTGPRHIKQTVGLDSDDINDSWRASPVLPAYREDIAAEYMMDRVDLRLVETVPSPSNYILTGTVAKAAVPPRPAPTPPSAPPAPPAPTLPPVPVKPPPAEEMEAPPPAPEPGAPAAGEAVEFGNTEFPPLMDFYVRTRGDGAAVGKKTFDKETAEYVTGGVVYAQAFTIERPLRVETISLAMHKFGGRLGSLLIDLVGDSGGRPGSPTDGHRSFPLFLDDVTYSPGYRWFDFAFGFGGGDGPVLPPGRYWIMLRGSPEAVVNWFYTPGNVYGGPDDSRSTEKGLDFNNVMNYDFNFMVRGIREAAGPDAGRTRQ